MEHEQELSAEERRALRAWVAAEAPADFADRVLAAATPARRPWRAMALAVAACAIGVVSVALWARGGAPQSGEVVATTRTTVDLGGRGVAVCEPGTRLRWSVAEDGAADVHEDAGSVFYRVEPGERFAVHTPAGEVSVTGTCFQVEVEAMKSGRALATGVAVGSILTAAMIVTVYEGSVSARTGEEETSIAAGESRRFEPGGPADAPLQATKRPAEANTPSTEQPSEPTPIHRTAPTADDVERRLIAEAATARERAKRLEAEVARLKTTLARKDKAEETHRTYDLSPETLRAMAEKCELRWDHPGIRVTSPQTLSTKDSEELGLTEDQRAIADAVFAESNGRLLAELRRIYTEATGDDESANLAPDAMIAEIQDKTSEEELKAVFQRLSSERAGLSAPSADAASAVPAEQLFRVMTTAGDALEAAFAAKLGKETAHALRSQHGGWGGKHRSSYGCPKR